jgi:hypothetical protein
MIAASEPQRPRDRSKSACPAIVPRLIDNRPRV